MAKRKDNAESMNEAEHSRERIRAAEFEVSKEGEESAHEVRASVSSETPVPQWVYDEDRREWVYGLEVLGHNEGEIDFSRMADGLVIQDTHKGDQIGIIREPTVREGKLGGVVEFGCGERAQEIRKDAIAGIRRNMSVGYFVNRWESTGEMRDGLPIYRAVDWTPYEASFVSVPADTRVGVARSVNITTAEKPATTQRSPKMDNEETRAALTAENVSEMYRLARAADMEPGAVDEHIKSGKSFDEFRALAIDALEKAKAERAKKPDVPPKADERRLFRWGRRS